ncbi:hypothetical protein ABPG72_003858 [Tetrahymena utriculariae]
MAHLGHQSDDIISVNLSDPVMKDGGKYIVYTISGSDKDGPFEVFRRYSDFDHFRTLLVQRWPGCFIPPIPSKKVIGNKETKFLEDRKNFLQYFVEKIAEIRHIWYSEENKEFIRNSSNDFEKVLNNLPKQTTDDIINKYKTCFSNLAGVEINNEINTKISKFKQFLETAAKKLDKMKAFCRTLSQSREKLDAQLAAMNNSIIPEYEKYCILEYALQNENLLVYNRDENLKANFREIEGQNKNNDYELLVNMIRMELKEVESFLEALKNKDMIEEKKQQAQAKLKTEQQEQTKLQAGKTTFKSLFSKGTKEDKVQKLEKSIYETQHELENYSLLADLITVIIGYIEVDKFKNQKQNRYYNIMQRVSNLQYNLNMKIATYWNSVKYANQQVNV